MKYAIRFLITAVIMAAFALIANTFVYSQDVGKNGPTKVESTELIQCTNPAGCVGKLRPDWPACPVCNTPISPSSSVSPRGDNLAEDIIFLFEKAHSLDKDIGEIKIKREKALQEKLANAKTYDIAYAMKVHKNLQILTNAYERTKAFLERGGEDVEGSLITGFIGGKPVWKKKGDFVIYPRRPKDML